MSPRKSKSSSEWKRLTEVELELMTLLWRLGEATVGEIQKALPKERPLAYTSISTVLRILEQKKILTSRKEGRGHTYIPLLTKHDYELTTLNHMVDNVFDGAPSALVRRLVETGISEDELNEIRSFLEGKFK